VGRGNPGGDRRDPGRPDTGCQFRIFCCGSHLKKVDCADSVPDLAMNLDIFRQVPLLKGALGHESSKFDEFQIKMELAQKSVTSSVRKIKKFKKLLNHVASHDDDQLEFEKTEQALTMAEASLSKAAQEISIAEQALIVLSKDFDEQKNLQSDADAAEDQTKKPNDYLAGMHSALNFAINSAEGLSGTVSNLTVRNHYKLPPKFPT
jgi:hypothetical protein